MQQELVMAVPRTVLFEPGHFQGLQPGGAAYLERVFDPRNSRFLPRAAAEEDPSWKQVIPYVILAHGDTVFCYRRGQRSTETRLRALHSVGLGGHIRHTDDSLFTAPGRAAYDAALERELTEEVEIGAAVLSDTLVGLINDDTTPVGRVHIGLVHIRRLAAPAVRPREQKIAAPRFATVADLLADNTAELESWSRLCLEKWERL